MMNTEEFINAIKTVVVNGSIESMHETLNRPPGKKPVQDLVELSDWFNKLNDENKRMLLKVIKQSVEMSVFSFLCILDGVTAIEDDQIKGRLTLHYEKNNIKKLLNDSNEEYLHNLFR